MDNTIDEYQQINAGLKRYPPTEALPEHPMGGGFLDSFHRILGCFYIHKGGGQHTGP